MLTVSAQQMDAMARAQEDAFVARQVIHLREDFQRPDVDIKAAEEAVRAGIARARAWGLRFEEDLILFLECMMILGPRFDSDPALPWVREILANQSIEADEKMDLIDERLLFGGGAPR